MPQVNWQCLTLDGNGQQRDSSCPVSLDLVRPHLADLRRTTSPEMLFSGLSHLIWSVMAVLYGGVSFNLARGGRSLGGVSLLTRRAILSSLGISSNLADGLTSAWISTGLSWYGKEISHRLI